MGKFKNFKLTKEINKQKMITKLIKRGFYNNESSLGSFYKTNYYRPETIKTGETTETQILSDSSWEPTTEPIELVPPESIDVVIKPSQPNPYNAIIPDTTHSSNIAFMSSKFDSYSSAVKYNPNHLHRTNQIDSVPLVDSDDELTSEKMYSKLKGESSNSRITG